MICPPNEQQNRVALCACGCGESIQTVSESGYNKRFKHGHNIRLREYKKGVDHHCWKGGRYLSPSGYMMIYAPTHPKRNPKNLVREHRLVWEQTHNACLLSWADVHHLNAVKHDNRPENLVAMTHAEHRRQEQLIDMSNRSCITCSSKDTYIDKTNRPIWFNQDGGFECKVCHMRRYNRTKRKP